MRVMILKVKNKTHASHFSSTKFHKAELSQQKLPHLVTLRLEGKDPFDIELVWVGSVCHYCETC